MGYRGRKAGLVTHTSMNLMKWCSFMGLSAWIGGGQ